MKLMKTLALAAGLLIVGSVVNAASAAVVTRSVNIRNGPGTNYRVIGQLRAGTRVDVGGCRGNWCRAAGGWVSASYLAGRGSTVMVNPSYEVADDVALGVGAFALGAVAGSAWGPGWGGYYGPGPGWGWYRPGWRPGPWGPGWRGRPVYWRGAPGWRGGPGWRGRPGWRGGPGWRGRPGWRGGPGFRGRPVYFRSGGFGRGFGGRRF